ncbi:MAG: response regulator [Bacillota bacterium]
MGKKVLIVDDSALMRAYIKRILARQGYSIIGEASTGSEAVDKYRKLKPNVATINLNMLLLL